MAHGSGSDVAVVVWNESTALEADGGWPDRLDALVDQGFRRIVLNIEGMKFVNSSAMVFLIQTHKRLHALRGELVLSAPTDAMKHTFSILGVERIFEVFPDDAEALRHFGNDDDGEFGEVGARL